jgi:DNA-binding FrmR family transcriptional regulator
MLDEKTKAGVLGRLRRIEGQVAGLRRMVEADQYCVDVLLQLSAVQGALGKVAQLVLGSHLETCVHDAVASGAEKQRRQKVEELMDVFGRFGHVMGK